MKRFILLFLVLLLSLTLAYKLFKSKDIDTLSNSIAVNINRQVTEKDIQNISNAGFKRVRLDIFWERVETIKGEYDFKSPGYDHIHSLLKKYNLQPYYILNYSNELYEDKRSIVTSKGREGFGNFVRAAVERYNTDGAIWEIWNEPDSETFWNPQPSYEDYIKLVSFITPIIKKIDSDIIVVGPALSRTSEKEREWLEEAFKKGLLNNIDAVSVHPYRNRSPESVVNDYNEIYKMIDKYKEEDRNIPLFAGEWGYSMAHLPGEKLSEMKQAEYFTRTILVNAWRNVGMSVWYNWKNDGENPNEREQNFGVVWSGGSPKLTYLAAQILTDTIGDYKFIKREASDSPNDYILEFQNKKGERAIVYWTTKEQHKVSIEIQGNKGHLISMLGATQEVSWSNDITLNVSTSPNYLLIK